MVLPEGKSEVSECPLIWQQQTAGYVELYLRTAHLQATYAFIFLHGIFSLVEMSIVLDYFGIPVYLLGHVQPRHDFRKCLWCVFKVLPRIRF